MHTFDGSSTEAVVPGLTANTTYCFEIRAHNVSGVGAWSEPSGCILTHPGLPTAPNPPVSAEVTQDGRVTDPKSPPESGLERSGCLRWVASSMCASGGGQLGAFNLGG